VTGILSATGGYEAFYGLHECPFDVAPNTQMLFESQSYATALDATILAIRSNTPLVVVTGAAGTGKTLFCRSFTEGLITNILLSEYAGAPSSREEFFARLGDKLASFLGTDSPPPAANEDLLTRCRDLVQRLAVVDGAALFVIDNADELSPELFDDIGKLLSFDTNDTNRLQLLLVGRPALKTLLERPWARDLAPWEMKRLELRPLQEEEIGPYIDKRLSIAREESSRVRFSAAAVRAIAQLSKGIPAEVNRVSDRALQCGFFEQEEDIDVRQVLGAAQDLGLDTPLDLKVADSSRLFGIRKFFQKWRVE